MGRGPESNENIPEPQAKIEGDTSVPTSIQPSVPLAPHGLNWLSVDGGRAWGPRPRLTLAESAREDQNQARLTESIDLHRN